MDKMQIDIYTHFFKVTKVHPSANYALYKAFQQLLQIQFVKIKGKFKRQNKCIFAAKSAPGEYRFHINYLPQFKAILNDMLINDQEIIYRRHGVPDGSPVQYTVNEKFVVRDYQQDTIDYILDEGRSKLVTIATGGGKGFVSMKTGELLGTRMFVMVLGRYKEKWRDELYEIYGDNLNLLMVRGLSELLRLIELGKTGAKLPDVIVVTTTTMQIYIKEWEKHQGKELEGMIPPEEIYTVLGIGYRIIDEAHQHFHMVFKNDLYTHLNKAVYLTATLESNDKFMLAMYNLMWPLATRSKPPKPKAYDRTVTLLYAHQHPERLRYKSQQGYSHVMYEQSIWKHVPSRYQYLDMIGDVVETYFIPQYKPGRRMLIFCSLVDTCFAVAEYLNTRFKEKQWKISKFTSGDPKSVIDTNDITISTLGKAGTALDVSGLVVCFTTVALAEPKANIQAKGRLRDIKVKPGFEDVDLVYLYTAATDIPTHLKYHQEKRLLFANRTTKHSEVHATQCLGQPMNEYLRYGNRPYYSQLQLPMKKK